MNTTFSNSFIIFPEHTNHMSPIIFGGKFMAELDLCAARCVRRFLYDSPYADAAVTHKADFKFLKPTYLGDFIIMEATIKETGKKSICVEVKAYRETVYEKEPVAEANFVFISVNLKKVDLQKKPLYLPYEDHGMDHLPIVSG